MMVIRPLLFAMVIAAASSGHAAELTGKATAVDSDVIEIGGTRIMLFGLESVERNQACRIDDKTWQCWPAAVRQLDTLLSQGETTCRPVRAPDRYGRILGLCELGGRSLNEAFVRTGFAVARADETQDFAKAEEAARAERIGLWQGTFMKPWEFRNSVGIFVDRP